MAENPLKHLWASWRIKYIQGDSGEKGCAFCNALAAGDSAENLIVTRAEHAFVILNKFPYTSGHLMIVPLEHRASLEDLTPAARAEMIELVSQFISVVRSVYRPEGFNVGVNIGNAAGAGIPGHVHIHVVPRWVGDTNFMTAIGQTRVLPETLDQTYLRIRETWEKTQYH